MLRNEIEKNMKQQAQKTIVLVYHENDKIGVYCELKGDYLCDYEGHRVDRKLNIWGQVQWVNGKPRQVKFDN